MKQKKIDHNYRLLSVILILVILALSIFIGKITYNMHLKNKTMLEVPKVSGIYTPIDSSNYTIIVLDNRISYHQALISDINKIMKQINEQLLKEQSK